MALSLGVFVATLSSRYGQLRTLSALNRASLLQLGLPNDFLATYIMALDAILVGAYALIGGIIFWRRSSNRAALYASLALVVIGTELTRSDAAVRFAQPMLHLPIILVFMSGTILIATFLFVFPNGRFVPGWTRWLAIVWTIFVLAWYLAPITLALTVPWPPVTISYPLVIGVLVLGLFAQIHRYRAGSSLAEQQQTKWVVFGLVVGILGLVGYLLLWPLLIPAVNEPGLSRVFYYVIGLPLFYAAVILLPLAIGFSILRYRLWQIDLIINRALVYGLLTGLLLAVYFASVLLLQSGFRSLTGQGSELAVILSTLVIATFFQPLRQRLQAFIDRRFYRSKYDAARTLTTFSGRLRDEVDLGTLSEELVDVVHETVQPTFVSFWFSQRGDEREPSILKDANAS